MRAETVLRPLSPHLALVLSLTSFMTLSRLLILCLRFLVCKMETRKKIHFTVSLCGINEFTQVSS